MRVVRQFEKVKYIIFRVISHYFAVKCLRAIAPRDVALITKGSHQFQVPLEYLLL